MASDTHFASDSHFFLHNFSIFVLESSLAVHFNRDAKIPTFFVFLLQDKDGDQKYVQA